VDAPTGGLVPGVAGRIGSRVGVRRPPTTPDRRWWAVGTLMRSYGDPGYAAYDVLLDGERSPQLFWYHQLEEIG